MQFQKAVRILLPVFLSLGCGAAENLERSEGMNRLGKETSAYLLAHADNPVNWYPWGDAAFAAAESGNKPIFLSVGYSSCHWCHVMEEESFQDPEVAALMNETFICIKVDREERPDIDNLYMKFTVAMTGGGGWPMTVIMTPAGKPFFAGTYFPKESNFGRIGMMQLIPLIAEQWEANREALTAQADEIEDAVIRSVPHSQEQAEVSSETMHSAFLAFKASFDPEYGGFGNAPKFPMPHNLLFLLRYWKATGEQDALVMAGYTLRAIRSGGVYDQIGFGVHRYSTDREWLVPHYEKMLYDQALLTVAFLEAYQATGDVYFAQAASEILDYVISNLTSPEGAFYASEDADSPGGEGAYYTWTVEELSEVLSPEQSVFATEHWNISENADILHLTGNPSLSAEQLTELELIRQTLLERRGIRPEPPLDQKILADWNGLMIAAMAQASVVLDDPQYLDAAVRSWEFISTHMMRNGSDLFHSYAGGRPGPDGFINDYVFLIDGLLEVHQATLDNQYLTFAVQLQDKLDSHFSDQSAGGYFFTGDYSSQNLTRLKESYDGAVPSGNSVELANLITLWKLTGEAGYLVRAQGIETAFGSAASSSPMAYSMMLSGVMYGEQMGSEIVLQGNPDDPVLLEMIQVVRSEFRPWTTLILSDTFHSGNAEASVCRNGACYPPVYSAEELRSML